MPIPVGYEFANQPISTALADVQMQNQKVRLMQQEQKNAQIMAAVNQILSGIQEYSKQKQGQEMIKKLGLTKEVPQPLTIQDYTDFAKSQGQKLGISGKLTPEEQISTAQKLISAQGITGQPKPRTKQEFDYNQMAKMGVTLGPSGEIVQIKPEIEKPDFFSQIMTYDRLQKEKGSEGGLNMPASTPDEAIAQIPKTESPEDYQIKPMTRNFKGIPQTIYVAEKKQYPSSTELKDITDISSNLMGLNRNLTKLQNSPELKKYLGPGIVQRPGAVADILGQMESIAPKGWNTFKADVDREFQKYRKWVTGVQAGYPELQWIAPDFPKATDKADIFISKSVSATEQMQQNKDMLIDYLSKNGKAVGKFKTSMGQSIPQQGASQPKTQEEYNALPSGSVYIDTDGQTKRKK